jgi:hypothetical protein
MPHTVRKKRSWHDYALLYHDIKSTLQSFAFLPPSYLSHEIDFRIHHPCCVIAFGDNTASRLFDGLIECANILSHALSLHHTPAVIAVQNIPPKISTDSPITANQSTGVIFQSTTSAVFSALAELSNRTLFRQRGQVA